MGEFKAEAKITPGFLEKIISVRMTQYVIRKAAEIEKAANETAKKYVEEAITNSPVYKGLSGNFPDSPGYDLQAEFGIRNPKPLVEKMLKILLDSVVVSPVRTKRSGFRNAIATVEVKYLQPQDYEDKLVNDPDFSYMSQRTVVEKEKQEIGGGVKRRKKRKSKTNKITKIDTVVIEWMKWLLDPIANSAPLTPIAFLNRDGNETERQYGITYNISSYEAAYTSRSGRAIMTSRKKRTKDFPYHLPKLIMPNSGKNFIDDIAKNRAFRQIITTRVRAAVEKAAKAKR